MKVTQVVLIPLLSILLICSVACNSSQEVVTYCSSGCQTSWLGDGTCQSACNNAACYYDNGDCSGSTPTPAATSTLTPTATSTPTPTPTQYTLTITSSPSSGGAVTRNDNGPYYYGNVVQLTASPNNYYEFDYWSGDASGSQITKSITITKNTHITAYFKLKDSDNDGLSDKEEDDIGSNPYVQDTDADGTLDGSDFWPTQNMKVRVIITQFTEVQQTCDPLGDPGDPHFFVKVGSMEEQDISGSSPSYDFDIPDNTRYVTVNVEAWDADGFWSGGEWDQYDISSSTSSQSISVSFDRGPGPSTATTTTTVTNSGNLNSGCPASITFQIKNLY